MSIEKNLALVRRLWDDFNRRQLDSILRSYAPNAVSRQASGEQFVGPEAIKAYAESYLVAFPDIQIVVDEIIAVDDRVITRFTVNGTHTGTLAGVPPTGKKVSVPGTSFMRLEKGKVVEEWELVDQMSLVRQLGLTAA